MKLIFSIFLALASLNTYAGWTGRWEHKNGDVVVGLSSNPQNPVNAKNSLIVIGYFKNMGCSPVVSVLVLNGQSLGQPVKQKTSKSKKNQLVITVNGKDFSNETKMTEYTSGMELAMHGENSLINALSDPTASFSARIGKTTILDFSSASGFKQANQFAKANCR